MAMTSESDDAYEPPNPTFRPKGTIQIIRMLPVQTRISMYSIAVLTLLIILVLVYPIDTQIAWQMALRLGHTPSGSGLGQVISDEDMKRDPPLGIYLSDRADTRTLKRLPGATKGYLLISIKDCASCIHIDLKNWSEQARARGLTLVLLTGASADDVAHFRTDIGCDLPVIMDGGNKVAAQLNAIWAGRPYLFSNDWRLVWKQDKHLINYDLFKDPDFTIGERIMEDEARHM